MTTEETQGFASEPGDASEAGKAAGAADQAAPEAPAAEAEAKAAAAATSEELTGVRRQLAERTADLQRLQAEYQNYRKRVERDRLTVREIAISNLLENLIPVLDDVGRAREHGELVGGFKSVGESLETVAAKMGLQQFGKEGEPFDPTVHEALMHSYAADVTETTCVQILQPGYRIGERIIRPAMVAVAEPQPGTQSTAAPDASADAAKADGAEES